jgi:hypothetical protein
MITSSEGTVHLQTHQYKIAQDTAQKTLIQHRVRVVRNPRYRRHAVVARRSYTLRALSTLPFFNSPEDGVLAGCQSQAPLSTSIVNSCFQIPCISGRSNNFRACSAYGFIPTASSYDAQHRTRAHGRSIATLQRWTTIAQSLLTPTERAQTIARRITCLSVHDEAQVIRVMALGGDNTQKQQIGPAQTHTDRAQSHMLRSISTPPSLRPLQSQ